MGPALHYLTRWDHCGGIFDPTLMEESECGAASMVVMTPAFVPAT
jgi:hypothetical protein